MKYINKKNTIWGLGLNDDHARELGAFIGELYLLRTWGSADVSRMIAADQEMPSLICFTRESCREYMALPTSETAHLELIPKMLILEEDASLETMREALDYGITDIVRSPLTQKKLSRTLQRATEASALHRDILNMTREIYLEREILENKNETLDFLVSFLTNIADKSEEIDIFKTAFTGLNVMFPVLSLHAALYSRAENEGHEVRLFISAPKNHPQYTAWHTLLMENAQAHFPGIALQRNVVTFSLPDARYQVHAPDAGHILSLPLVVGKESIGVLTLLTNMEKHLNRDQAMALDSAMRHMALTIKNMQRFQEMCQFADYDSLTEIHNRRHFEITLAQELERHSRYSQSLSLLLLDLDHFKNVNDSWGHLVGDTVLQSVSHVIRTTIRKTDYCARYGGEEFVIILPHTDRACAYMLAERLRSRIENLQHKSGSKLFTVSISIGATCLETVRLATEKSIMHEADLALYQAKAQGRNQVVIWDESITDQTIKTQAGLALAK